MVRTCHQSGLRGSAHRLTIKIGQENPFGHAVDSRVLMSLALWSQDLDSLGHRRRSKRSSVVHARRFELWLNADIQADDQEEGHLRQYQNRPLNRGIIQCIHKWQYYGYLMVAADLGAATVITGWPLGDRPLPLVTKCCTRPPPRGFIP